MLQKAKARVDCKGGKVELPLTQGETIEIVRLTDNPEGLWLARNTEGLCAFAFAAVDKRHMHYSSFSHFLSTERHYSVLCRLITDGYVKTAAVEVDHNALKAQIGQTPDGASEVYDDVDVRLVYSHLSRSNDYRYRLFFFLLGIVLAENIILRDRCV